MQARSTSKVPFFVCNPLPTPLRSPTRLSTVKCSTCLSRRHFLSASMAATAALLLPPQSEAVSGLHIFPLKERLMNAYFLMRACETNSDASKIVNSNPAYKLSLEQHSLTRRGVDQAIRASEALRNEGLSSDAWLWPSVTISAFQTAEILASKLRIRREQIVPEYSFLDARGVGALDGGTMSEVRRIVIDNDQKDPDWHPESGEDGTPNDSTNDVFVRVRQLLSKLETQYYGENIVIISPDSDPLSILEATLTGRELQSHHEFEYFPGEVRRVKELVTDDYGKTVVQPETLIVCKPDTSLLV